MDLLFIASKGRSFALCFGCRFQTRLKKPELGVFKLVVENLLAIVEEGVSVILLLFELVLARSCLVRAGADSLHLIFYILDIEFPYEVKMFSVPEFEGFYSHHHQLGFLPFAPGLDMDSSLALEHPLEEYELVRVAAFH